MNVLTSKYFSDDSVSWKVSWTPLHLCIMSSFQTWNMSSPDYQNCSHPSERTFMNCLNQHFLVVLFYVICTGIYFTAVWCFFLSKKMSLRKVKEQHRFHGRANTQWWTELIDSLQIWYPIWAHRTVCLF